MISGKKLGTAELLFRSAQRLGLQPTWIRPQSLFAISIDGEEQYINSSRSPLNSHVGMSLAKDKNLTRLILERHHLPNIPFLRPDNQAEAAAFLQRFGTIVAKPVRGAGAHDIHIVTSRAQLMQLPIPQYILEQYIPGREMRYLVLNDKVIAVHESEYGASVDEHRALQRISYPRHAWDDHLVTLSKRIAHILGLRFAAVDFMITAPGRAYVLEVNTEPGLKWFHAPTSGPVVDVAGLFFEALLQENAPLQAVPGRSSLPMVQPQLSDTWPQWIT